MCSCVREALLSPERGWPQTNPIILGGKSNLLFWTFHSGVFVVHPKGTTRLTVLHSLGLFFNKCVTSIQNKYSLTAKIDDQFDQSSVFSNSGVSVGQTNPFRLNPEMSPQRSDALLWNWLQMVHFHMTGGNDTANTHQTFPVIRRRYLNSNKMLWANKTHKDGNGTRA